MFHDRKMNGVARGKLLVANYDFLRALGDDSIYGQHLIDNSKQRTEGRLNRLSPVNGHEAMQYLLEHFGVGDETLAIAGQLLEPTLGVGLVRMRAADEIHGNIGVDENHGLSFAR